MNHPMKQIITNILNKHQLAHAFAESREFHLRLERAPYMPLVIEHVGDIISVAHYGEQNGDAMRDPEVTFNFETWMPLSFRQDYLGLHSEVENERAANPRLQRELLEFSAMWARNIRDQGWLERDVKATSLTHAHLLEAAQAGTNAPAPDSHLEQFHEDRNGCWNDLGE